MKKLLTCFLTLVSSHLFALDLELTQGISSALPIGINSFGENSSAQEITSVINNDLRLSGQFKIISLPAMEMNGVGAWKQAGADSVLTGRVTPIGSNRYDISFELLDTVSQNKLLLSKSFQVSANDIRPLAHHISDMVYEKLTGERGIFSTRIAYVLVQRAAGRARYSLEVADADGYNPQSLLVSPEPIMSPSWSPDGSKIAYVSFEKRKAQIFIVSVESGKRQLVTDFSGINGAPTWSPDGRQLAVVLSKSGSPKIYSIDLSSGSMKQLTFGDSIDTEPRYTPDGRSLIFTSGRGGSPQVYKLSLADGSINRITYDGNYNARAMFTPDQKHLVMYHRDNGKFNIGVQDMNSGQVSLLTFASLDESPSVSPNGRLVLYATRFQDKGVLGVVSIDGRIRLRLPARQGDVQEPAWSPYLG
ncbi:MULTISPECIES: Tol-Pal system beta propeller repeat protein TolB [Legionella]|nr:MULTISPECIES: Tol-Pal system beta propeller repeat protein TolB [Legionella]MCW8451010.1 Tol-Pal system beta propeller repeat protein TolB [Legionella quinlivanii]RAP36362.1 Tol-Pal system beta propeller repeat protein TolB [Legionella quinlivanii]